MRSRNAVGGKRPRQTGNHQSPSTVVTHYPSALPFPVFLDEEFPYEAYRSRNKDVKSAIHWGQRKLMISEIQFLSMYPERGRSYHIVYVGSAPGTHIAVLDEMFEKRHTWELIDPGEFDLEALSHLPNFTLRSEFFTNQVAYDLNVKRIAECCPALSTVYYSLTRTAGVAKELIEELQSNLGSSDVARSTESVPSMYEPEITLPLGLGLLFQVAMDRSKPLLFISDIRTGNLAMPNFEEHVSENMKAQECWTKILAADFSMLKFRLPYTKLFKKFGGRDEVKSSLIQPDGTVPYLRGDMLLPVWTRPTSTEGRLVVRKGASTRQYNVERVEGQFFFFNCRLREQVHFNHFVQFDEDYTHHFDAAAELHCFSTYIRYINPAAESWPSEKLQEAVRREASRLTAFLGMGFEDAIRRRNALILKQSAAGGAESHEAGKEAQPSKWHLTAQRQIEKAKFERERPVWSVNVNETQFHSPSGFWVTTVIPQ